MARKQSNNVGRRARDAKAGSEAAAGLVREETRAGEVADMDAATREAHDQREYQRKRGEILASVFPSGTTTATHERDERGVLTRAGMEEAVAAGGSVLWKGTFRRTIAELPDEAEIAEGDERLMSQAEDGLRQQREELDRRLNELSARRAGKKPGTAPKGANKGVRQTEDERLENVARYNAGKDPVAPGERDEGDGDDE